MSNMDKDKILKVLKDNGKFALVSPKQLMQPIKETHQDLYNYLETRYWQ